MIASNDIFLDQRKIAYLNSEGVDLSRSWTCGFTPMMPQQSELYSVALEQINHNLELLRPGLELREFNEKSWQIPQQYQAFRYPEAAHGVGMVTEWPIIPLHPDYASAYDARLEQNMVLCVESLIAEPGSESIKLETQVVITENAHLALDSFPLEDITHLDRSPAAETLEIPTAGQIKNQCAYLDSAMILSRLLMRFARYWRGYYRHENPLQRRVSFQLSLSRAAKRLWKRIEQENFGGNFGIPVVYYGQLISVTCSCDGQENVRQIQRQGK